MKFSLSPVVSAGVHASKLQLVVELSEQLSSCFRSRNYGLGAHTIAARVICVEQGFESAQRLRPPAVAAGVIEFDVVLDYSEFVDTDRDRAEALLSDSLLDGVARLRTILACVPFDFDAFIGDLRLAMRPGSLNADLVGRGVDDCSEYRPLRDSGETLVDLKLNTEIFWDLVNLSLEQAEPKGLAGQVESIEAQLKRLDLNSVLGFELALREHIRMADCYNVLAALKIRERLVTDDSFLYFRCGLIAGGRFLFESVLDDPDAVAPEVLGVPDGERLLYAADEAFTSFENIQGVPTPRQLGERYYDYDTACTPPKGKAWREDELPVLFPRLWRAARGP